MRLCYRTPYSDGVQNTVAQLLASGRIDELLAAHRATFGDLRMEDPPTPAPAPAPAPVPAADDKKFSQEDMNATVARETEKAKQAALEQVAKDLGVTLDEAKQIIADRKAADDQNKTEAQRAADAWKTAQSGAEEIKRAAEQEKHDAKVERELQRAGFDITNATMLPAAMAAVAPHVQVGADDAAVKTAVEKVKTDAPQLFVGADGKPGGTPSDPGRQRTNPDAPAGEFGAGGKAEADRRFAAERERQKQPA